MFSTGTEHWSTPEKFFEQVDSIFNFTLDACADTTNYKVKNYYNKKQNGLAQDWSGHTVWVNPPYGKETKDWVAKASEIVSEKYSSKVTSIVMLLPARMDTKWMHDYVLSSAKYIVFLKGRLKFSGSKTSAPFPSMLAVFTSIDSNNDKIESLLKNIGFTVIVK